MTTDNCKDNLPRNTYCEGDDVNWDKVHRAVHEAIPYAAGIITSQQANDNTTPAINSFDTHLCHGSIGLVTNIVHTVEHRRECCQPDGNHDAFQIHTITNVRCAMRYTAWRV